MGFTPTQIDALSIWQYMACINGYVEAHSTGDNGASMAHAEYDDIAASVLALS